MPPSPDKPGGHVAALGEFALIDRLKRLVPSTGPGVVTGIGDDAAVLRLSGEVLATCDVQVEGVHFTLDLVPPSDLGWRALAVNVSDIAAMGGTPRYALVSLVLPPETAGNVVEEIYAGLAEAATAHGVVVVGGNVSATSGPLVIDITLLGEAGIVVRRSGACPGDGVWMTGAAGKAAGGLFLLHHPDVRVPDRDALVSAYRRPVPRVAVGQALAVTGLVTALVDTSDGTAQDLLHLIEASGAGVSLDLTRVPLAEGLPAVAHAAGVDPAAWALGGGEDYELLFTAAPAFAEAAPDLARITGVPLTRIGDVLPPDAGRWLVHSGGHRVPLAAAGWNHFGDPGARV